jgi:hypothetical protein
MTEQVLEQAIEQEDLKKKFHCQDTLRGWWVSWGT